MATVQLKKSLAATIIAVSALCLGIWRAEATTLQTNLVSDVSDLGAAVVDPSLANPWGVSHSPTSPFWVSDQLTGVATLYNVTGSTTVSKNPLTVTIPTTATGPQGPTGQVNNTNTASFQFNGAFSRFIFANLNGTISAWNGVGTVATIQATTPGAVYTGLAINQAQTQLYAVNNATGHIDVFSSSFAPVNLGATAFATPSAISAAGLVPFNAQNINGQVFVTYAPATLPGQRGATPGMGAVAVFDENGLLIRTMDATAITKAGLAAPWGITLAPASFGQFGGELLVGNFSFGHSSITALDPITLAALGSIMVDVGSHTPGGLWFLGFGQGGNNGDPNTLYFADGIDGETHGLFGAINEVPIPSALPLFVTGLGTLGLLGWRRKRKAS